MIAQQNEAGEWILDIAATEDKRETLRQARLDESITAEQWWQEERPAVEQQGFSAEVKEMYGQSLSFAKFDKEFRGFWQLPDDYHVAEEA